MNYLGNLYLISTPEFEDLPLHPGYYCRWLATESPNIFQFRRMDFDVVSVTSTNRAGIDYLQITVTAGTYTGKLANSITIFNPIYNVKYSGTVYTFGATVIETDIPWIASMAASLATSYLNDNTLYGGFYVEARLIVNGDLLSEQMNIVASPDSFGIINLDVSGVLRIMTALGKDGTYGIDPATLLFDDDLALQKEEKKSGYFELEYRTRWFGEYDDVVNNTYVSCCSPALIWWYGEVVRSEEQGSNLHDFVADANNEAPFLNSFDQPVYFRSLPWDISFILPEVAAAGLDATVDITFYNSIHGIAGTKQYVIDIDTPLLDGHIVSLAIDPTIVPLTATYLTATISVP